MEPAMPRLDTMKKQGSKVGSKHNLGEDQSEWLRGWEWIHKANPMWSQESSTSQRGFKMRLK